MANAFTLKLGSSDLPGVLASSLRSISVSDALERLDEVEARFILRRAVEDTSNIAWHGEEFTITVQAGSDARRLKGHIIEVGLERTSEGLILTLRGIDELHSFKQQRWAAAYEGTHSDVAEAVAGDGGAGSDVEGVSGTAAIYLMANVTGAQFLASLARRNNYVVRFDAGQLRFVRKESAGEGAAVDIPWKDVRRYRVTHSLDGVVDSVNVVGYDPVADEVIKGMAAASDASQISGTDSAPSIVESKFGGVELTLDNTDITTTSEAEAYAKAELQRRAERFVRGSFLTSLNPAARSGAFANITDAPWPIGGKVLISEVTHIYNTGTQPHTRIKFISDSLPKK